MMDIKGPTQSRVWRWRRAIGDSDLHPTTRDILRVLSEFMDRDGGSCFPTRAVIADKSGRDPKTVSRNLKLAADAGWLEIQDGILSGQRWRSQSYVARFPSEKVRESCLQGEGDTGEGEGAMPDKVGAPCPQDNTSPLTSPNNSPINSSENAGARALTRADRHRINREFLRWLPTWPNYSDYSDATARREWFMLSEDERRACISLTPVYVRQFGKKRSSPGDYLKDRAWEGLPSSVTEPAPERIVAKSFSPLWMVARFWLLLQEPSGRITLTKFDQQMIDEGRATLDDIRRPKLIAGGWPPVNAMMTAMRNKQPFSCPSWLEQYAGELRPVQKDSDLYAAWARLHDRRCWPFFSFAPNYLPFPHVDLGTDDLDAAVEAAMTAFAMLISKVE